MSVDALEASSVASGIHGSVRQGFEPVAQEFAANFTDRGELGAAFSVTLDGAEVVSVWGGVAAREPERPWTHDTLAVIFSGTKGLVAACALILVDRGQLDLDAPVAYYWPEFGAAGKSHVTVGEILSHQGRLPGVRAPLQVMDLLDPTRLENLLGAQPQETDDRAARAYHGLTYGWLAGGLIRRATGRSVGRFFSEEIALPLGISAWIGLPAELGGRVAELEHAPNWVSSATPEMLAGDDLLATVWNNPPILGDEIMWNRPDFRRSEIPGAGGIASAWAMARFYGCLALDGTLDGVQLMSAETLQLGLRMRSDRLDPLQNDYPHVFATGFQLQNSLGIYGPPADAFGHNGAGGSVHCAWPTEHVGVSYVMNQMRNEQLTDPRAIAPLQALYDCLH